MANKIEEKALTIAEQTAEEMGLYIVDVSYSGGVLCYSIDKRGGVGIDDCEAFSRAVEVILDNNDIIDTQYSLEVSSPGVDRKLKKEREFMYYIGRSVEVKLYAAKNGVKEFEGILIDYREKTAVIETEGENIEIPLNDAVYIRFKFVKR